MKRLELITPPVNEPVSLIEAKAHLRVVYIDEDALITRLISVAREYCEYYQRLVYISQIWRQWFSDWGLGVLELGKYPLQGVMSVLYYDPGNIEYILPLTDYRVDMTLETVVVTKKPDIILRSYDAVAVMFTAGKISAPEQVRHAILLLVSQFFENREAIENKSDIYETIGHLLQADMRRHESV